MLFLFFFNDIIFGFLAMSSLQMPNSQFFGIKFIIKSLINILTILENGHFT